MVKELLRSVMGDASTGPRRSVSVAELLTAFQRSHGQRLDAIALGYATVEDFLRSDQVKDMADLVVQNGVHLLVPRHKFLNGQGVSVDQQHHSPEGGGQVGRGHPSTAAGQGLVGEGRGGVMSTNLVELRDAGQEIVNRVELTDPEAHVLKVRLNQSAPDVVVPKGRQALDVVAGVQFDNSGGNAWKMDGCQVAEPEMQTNSISAVASVQMDFMVAQHPSGLSGELQMPIPMQSIAVHQPQTDRPIGRVGGEVPDLQGKTVKSPPPSCDGKLNPGSVMAADQECSLASLRKLLFPVSGAQPTLGKLQVEALTSNGTPDGSLTIQSGRGQGIIMTEAVTGERKQQNAGQVAPEKASVFVEVPSMQSVASRELPQTRLGEIQGGVPAGIRTVSAVGADSVMVACCQTQHQQLGWQQGCGMQAQILSGEAPHRVAVIPPALGSQPFPDAQTPWSTDGVSVQHGVLSLTHGGFIPAMQLSNEPQTGNSVQHNQPALSVVTTQPTGQQAVLQGSMGIPTIGMSFGSGSSHQFQEGKQKLVVQQKAAALQFEQATATNQVTQELQGTVGTAAASKLQRELQPHGPGCPGAEGQSGSVRSGAMAVQCTAGQETALLQGTRGTAQMGMVTGWGASAQVGVNRESQHLLHGSVESVSSRDIVKGTSGGPAVQGKPGTGGVNTTVPQPTRGLVSLQSPGLPNHHHGGLIEDVRSLLTHEMAGQNVVLLNRLPLLFFNKYGRVLEFRSLGFSSLLELVTSISDTVEVADSSLGKILGPPGMAKSWSTQGPVLANCGQPRPTLSQPQGGPPPVVAVAPQLVSVSQPLQQGTFLPASHCPSQSQLQIQPPTPSPNAATCPQLLYPVPLAASPQLHASFTAPIATTYSNYYYYCPQPSGEHYYHSDYSGLMSHQQPQIPPQTVSGIQPQAQVQALPPPVSAPYDPMYSGYCQGYYVYGSPSYAPKSTLYNGQYGNQAAEPWASAGQQGGVDCKHSDPAGFESKPWQQLQMQLPAAGQ